MNLQLVSRQPSSAPKSTPLLFVHGAWHSAWCWDENFLPYFAAHGYAAHALSLRGHGASEGRPGLRWASLADYADDVASVAAALPAPPVVVGHSMGGMVVQHYLAAHRAPAAVLLASAPPAGVIPTTLRVARAHPLTFLKTNLALSLYPIVGTPERAREFLFSQAMPRAQSDGYFAKLQDESYRAYLDMMLLNLPNPRRAHNTPVLVLGAADDKVFTVSEVQATARAYGAEAHIFPAMAHDMMLEPGWQTVADRILAWLAERGL
ncbi:MAG: alpha/beta hydrolase [Chloroflexi bacterium]|nr:alpha/beta hydrolase [Chloroflexota bacterium]